MLMMELSAIEVDELTVRFDGAAVIERFSLRVGSGEKIVLTGRSGCGKSTVLGCVLGFVQPEHGIIHIAGEQLTSKTVWKLRANIAYVAQEPDIGKESVRRILERPFHYHANRLIKNNLCLVPQYFDRFGLAHSLLEKDITSLSGGEKQRLALISAILLGRKIILLDEATSALDKTARQAVTDYISSCKDLTVLCVAHDSEAMTFADRVVELPYCRYGEEKT